MESLAELPDEDPGILPQGNLRFSNMERRVQFYNDLHDTIVAQVLGNRTRHCEILDGERMIFELPGKEQIHDFVTLHVVAGIAYGSHALSVVLKIPSTKPDMDGKYKYLTEVFEYAPPRVPGYLDKFSSN